MVGLLASSRFGAHAIELMATMLGPASTEDLGWLGDAPWAKVGLVITVAVFVLTIGGAMAKRKPRGSGVNFRGKRDFDLQVAKLESLAVSPIASATSGPVHLEGVLSSANETLGGPPQSARIYHNRKGASRKAAVAAELVLLRDDSGQASIEQLELARVIAATDPKADGRSQAADTISLHIGDRVQVLGYFRAELHGDDDLAAERVFGVLGDDGQIQVRLLERPAPDAEAESENAETDQGEAEAAEAESAAPLLPTVDLG